MGSVDETENPGSEVSGFDLDRSTDQAWTEFSARLSDVIAHLDPGAQLTIGAIATEQDGRAPFVSFACDAGRHVIAEAAANAVLSDQFQLSEEQLVALEEAGWNPPNVDDEHPSENFWRRAPQEASAELAAAAVAVLRGVYQVPHPVFLAPDQLAEVLTPPSKQELPPVQPPAFAAEDVIATVIGGRDQLDRLVSAELEQLLGHPALRDDDGDYAIRVGSTMVFVRPTGDAREVLVFSAVVHDVDGRSRAMEVLSDLNAEARFVRFLLLRDRVFVSLSIFAQPFVPAHLHQALQTVSIVADQIDDELAAKLRGRTTFSGDA